MFVPLCMYHRYVCTINTLVDLPLQSDVLSSIINKATYTQNFNHFICIFMKANVLFEEKK